MPVMMQRFPALMRCLATRPVDRARVAAVLSPARVHLTLASSHLINGAMLSWKLINQQMQEINYVLNVIP